MSSGPGHLDSAWSNMLYIHRASCGQSAQRTWMLCRADCQSRQAHTLRDGLQLLAGGRRVERRHVLARDAGRRVRHLLRPLTCSQCHAGSLDRPSAGLLTDI